MIAKETENVRRNREEIVSDLSEIIDRLHEKHSWQVLERKIGVSSTSLISVWRGDTPNLRTAIMILDAVGCNLKIEKK